MKTNYHIWAIPLAACVCPASEIQERKVEWGVVKFAEAEVVRLARESFCIVKLQDSEIEIALPEGVSLHPGDTIEIAIETSRVDDAEKKYFYTFKKKK